MPEQKSAATHREQTRLVRAWFFLTAQERLFVAGIVLILLVGLVARYAYLRNQGAEPLTPPGREQAP